MTPEELVAGLADVRVPESFARFGVQDALAACALGLLAGLLISALLKLITGRRTTSLEKTRKAIAALALQDRQIRLTGLAALLRRNGGRAPEGLQEALYDPQASFDPAKLEAAVLAAAKRGRKR